MFSTSGSTGVSGSSPGKRDVQYLLVLLNSASQAARPATSGAAYPRTSGKCWRPEISVLLVGAQVARLDAAAAGSSPSWQVLTTTPPGRIRSSPAGSVAPSS